MKRPLTMLLVMVLVLSSTMVAPRGAKATNPYRNNSVLIVHGWVPNSYSGENCDIFNSLNKKLVANGWSGDYIEQLAYYSGDVNCDHTINHHGQHGTHYPSGHVNTSTTDGKPTAHNQNASIRHLGYHLAWYIYSHYSSNNAGNKYVDVVAHSMGGLIIRYALAQVRRGHSSFPPYLRVDDVVTLGTPHAGTTAAYFANNTQADEMEPTSGFIGWLWNYGRNPQGLYGTDCTTIGSNYDGIVSAGSANEMDAYHKVKLDLAPPTGGDKYYPYDRIGHNDYWGDYHNTTDRSGFYEDGVYYDYIWSNTLPHTGNWIDKALYLDGW